MSKDDARGKSSAESDDLRAARLSPNVPMFGALHNRSAAASGSSKINETKTLKQRSWV
jgi:hypothetical protein